MFRCLHLVFITDICRLIGLHDAHSFIMFFYFQTCKCKHSTHFCVQVTSLLSSRSPWQPHNAQYMYNAKIQQSSHSGILLIFTPFSLNIHNYTYLRPPHLLLPSSFTQKQAWIHLVSPMQLNSLQVRQGEEFNMSYKGLQCISGKSFETVKGVSSNIPM